MTISLHNVIAVVTGAAGGIGRAICASLREAGATVIATDLPAEAKGVAADAYLHHDVISQEDWRRVAAYVKEKHGRLDALVNNAGISIVGKIEDTPIEEWRRVNAVNFDSIVVGVQTFLPLLKEGGKARKGGASIVNFSSVAGQRGAALNAAYCASKGAVKLLSKSMAAEFGVLGYNIRCNSVHPGAIDTAMINSIINRYVELGAVASFEAAHQSIVANHPIGRFGRPDEIGGGVVYLCSDAASFVTGSEFVIDGGFTAI
jgi:NAD(P)-dependent dehydrogenase (short-subunit alcohol dehydrogenase family)